MKISVFARVLALLLGHAAADEFTISSCAELAAVDDTTVSVLSVTSSSISCDEYTRFRVRNSMVLESTEGEIAFTNVSFKVLGELTVEPDVTFTGVVDQVKNGGVIYVDEGATATFMGTSHFFDNSVYLNYNTECGEGCSRTGRGLSYATKKGAALHNKGSTVFEGDATFTRNTVHTSDSTDQGRGGAISNNAPATILFNSKLTMIENEADGFFEGIGGGMYNRGDIIVQGESLFFNNDASDGGGIYNEDWASITFNAFANFTSNTVSDLTGAAIANNGGNITFNAGSIFENNAASGSGDGGLGGGIYNSDEGVVTLTGSTTFRNNRAFIGGAIYSVETDGPQIVTYPDDTIFEDNSADYCPNVYTGDRDNCEA